MKKTIIIPVLLILMCSASFSQEYQTKKSNDDFKTLLGHDNHSGFYGALTIGYSEIQDNQAITFGGRMEWIAGHSIGIGFGGTGFINEHHYEPLVNSNAFLTGGFGGIYIEPIVMPNYPVHFSFPLLLGGGGISYVTENHNHDNRVADSEAFLIAEPGAELELNLTRFFRLAIGASYRFTTPFDFGTTQAIAVDSRALHGFTFTTTFKFGKF